MVIDVTKLTYQIPKYKKQLINLKGIYRCLSNMCSENKCNFFKQKSN